MQTKLAADTLDDLRVIPESEAIHLANVSPASWSRMRQRGETPPLVRISRRRIGYRVSDLKKWIEARVEPSKYDPADIPSTCERPIEGRRRHRHQC